MKFRVLSRKQRRDHFIAHNKANWTPFFAIWPRRIDSEHLIIGHCVRILEDYDRGNLFPCDWKYRALSDHAAAKLLNKDKKDVDAVSQCPICGYHR